MQKGDKITPLLVLSYLFMGEPFMFKFGANGKRTGGDWQLGSSPVLSWMVDGGWAPARWNRRGQASA